MSIKFIIYLIASVIFFASSSFIGGVENSFTFLFWCHLIILIPIIIVWFVLQVFGLSIALSPILAGLMGGSALMVGGWLLLAFFGINTALTYYISENAIVTDSALILPISTQIAIFLYLIFNLFAPKYKASFIKKQAFKTESKTGSDEIVIDAEWSETSSESINNKLEHKGEKK